MLMITEQEISETLAAIEADLRFLGVKSLLLAGSAARIENTESSDLDFVVDFDGPATFDRFMGLADLLEQTFGRPVDLSTRNSLRREIAARILQEAKRVA